MAEALIFENLEGDLYSFRQSGMFCFQSAINGYFDPGVDEFNKYKKRTDLKDSLIPPPLVRSSLLLKHMQNSMGKPMEDHILKVEKHVDAWSRSIGG